jgi:hypothetical protein
MVCFQPDLIGFWDRPEIETGPEDQVLANKQTTMRIYAS